MIALPRRARARHAGFCSATTSLLISLSLAACSGSRADSCDGFIEPSRSISSSPATLTLDVGVQGQVTATVASGCTAEDRSVRWESSDTLVASIDVNGRVKAIGAGNATLTATAFDQLARTVVPVTIRPRVATRIDARPHVDTLAFAGVRSLVATVRDQIGDVLSSAPVTWRSLTPSLAVVSATGGVRAVSSGTAQIEAATPSASADSLRDTVRIVILPAPPPIPPVTPPPATPPTPPVAPTPPAVTPTPPVTPPTPPVTPPTPPVTPTPPPVTPPVPPAPPRDCRANVAVQLGTTVAGRFDATTCQNVLGYRIADQYAITATQQRYFSIRLASTVRSALVPLIERNAFHGLAAADTAVTAYVVMRIGTFGFLVGAPTPTFGTYTIRTELNPDPRSSCAPTHATVGVTFSTAVTSSCTSRDILLVPTLIKGEQLRITVTTPGRPVTIELRNARSGTLLKSKTTTSGSGRATIEYEVDDDNAELLFARVIGGPGVNELLQVTIARAP